MYKLLLTIRYLRRKLIPWFALAAVTLCVGLLIVVLSIMGGFHDLLQDSGKKLMGDVKMYAGAQGFPHYEELLDAIRKLPETQAATATIETFGLLQTPGGSTKVIEVVGIVPDELENVTRFEETLYWTKDRLAEHDLADIYGKADPYEAGVKMQSPWAFNDGRIATAMVTGIEVNPYNIRTPEGKYQHGYTWMAMPLSITLVPVSNRGGLLEPSVHEFVTVNEFNSGMFDIDSQRVYVPFARAQKMLLMDEADRVDPNDPLTVIGKVPARATAIIVRAKPGITSEQMRDAVSKLYDGFVRTHEGLPPEPYMTIATWRQIMRSLLDTVKNEKNMMTALFGVISLVTVVLVLVIFYMIVLEKTKDVGILRSLGASRTGIASIFLSFSAVIGILGALLGTLGGFLTIHYINDIHAWFGNGLGAAVFYVGIPLGSVIGVGLLLLIQHVIRLVFEMRRWTMVAVMPLLGSAGGGLLVLALLALTAFDRMGTPSTGWLDFALRALLVPPAALLPLSVGFAATDRTDRPIPVRTLLTWMAIAGVGSIAFVLIAMGSTDWPARFNDAIRFQIWDRRVYFFDEIPNQVDWFEVVVICIVSVVASVIGAVIPAVKAALADPVESLRYE